jgi:DNA repair exonuclease SbcCD ATPase subunit
MKIHSIRLSNYRVHSEQRIRFDPRLTLIGGPNESGKSTVVEALHRALFLKASGGTEAHRAMQSSSSNGQPEVELVFEVGGRTHTLLKKFGKQGVATLSSDGRGALRGAEAEDALSSILQLQGEFSRKQLPAQWSHLFAWQGQSGAEPVEFMRDQQDNLFQRLQEKGAAGVLLSPLDQEAADHFQELADQTFVKGGKIKAGTPLAAASQRVQSAQERIESARVRLQQMRTALSRLREAESSIKEADRQISLLSTESEANEQRRKALAGLQTLERDQAREAGEAQSKLQVAKKRDLQIRGLAEEISRLDAELTPKTLRIKEGVEAADSARQEVEASRESHENIEVRFRVSRLEFEIAEAYVRLLELKDEVVLMEKREAEIAKLAEQSMRLQEQRARFPQVDKRMLKKLRQLDLEFSNAKATLAALGVGIRVIESGENISAGRQPMRAGDSLTVCDNTEIMVGDKARILIVPGGGEGLAGARRDEESARRKFESALVEAGVPSLDEASNAFERRDEIENEIRTISEKIDGLRDEGRLDKLRLDMAEVQALLDRVLPQAPGYPAPAGVEQAKTVRNDLRRVKEACEHDERESRRKRDAASKTLQRLDAELNTMQEEARGQQEQLSLKTVALDFQVKEFGADDVRMQDLLEKTAAELQRRAALESTRKEIAALQPDQIESDNIRLKRALKQMNEELIAARDTRSACHETLRLDGISDPEAELKQAEGEVEFADQEYQRLRLRGDAHALLRELFQNERKTLAEQFTRPLAEKVSAYLQCVFGPEARLELSLEGNDFTGMKLSRSGEIAGEYTFESLSLGTREQAAAAVRLAVAEILAEGHDGSLPVIFDDAFAYSDPERAQVLQRMLDRAANNGLQVIVLSCTPADYSGLGARTVKLRREDPVVSSRRAGLKPAGPGEQAAAADVESD